MSRGKFPDSLWSATAIEAPRYAPLEGERTVDVCVVGAGFTGLSAALHAAEAGASVAVLEAEDVGWGASGRNGGQVIPGLKQYPDELVDTFGAARGEALADFAGRAPDVVFGLVERLGLDCGAQRSGWISAMHAPGVRGVLESRVEQWRRRGVDLEWLGRDEVGSRLGTGTYLGGYCDPRGGKLQPLSFARGLARAAAEAGVAVFSRTPAERVGRASGGWRVLCEHGSVVAPQVLLCTNGYTDRLWPGLAETVIPAYSFQVATRPLGDNLRAGILPGGEVVSDTRRLLRYFRLDAEGRLIMGGRGRYVDSSRPELYGEVIASLDETFPDLAGTALEHYWSGCVAITVDHIPHLHEVAPGVHAGLGYNGRGVAMSTAMGKLLAERAGGKPAGEVPFPTTEPRAVPFHALRGPGVRVAGWWRGVLDRLETRFAGWP